MLKLTPQQTAAMQRIARQEPELLEIVSAWRSTELESLPYGVGSNLDVLRGRVQTLTELREELSKGLKSRG